MRFAGVRSSLPAFLVLALCAPFVRRMEAQAWLNPKGEASLSIGYGNNFVKQHLGLFGEAFDDGHIRSNSVAIDLEYAITNRLSADFAVPWIESKYMGTDPHVAPDGSTIDTGQYHGTFQDYAFALRWGAVTGQLAFTPYVTVIIPSHDYRYFAHSAAGRDLRELLLGFFTARRLDELVEGSYVQLRYSYAFVEKVLGIFHNQSSGDLSVGYFLTPALGIRGIMAFGYTHGGLPAPEDPVAWGKIYCDPVLQCGPGDPTPRWLHHDQITHDVYVHAGGGIQYALTGAVDVYVTYLSTVTGTGGHKIKDAWGFGFAWNFSPVQLARQFSGKSASGQ
jgi:hypothetical protein